MNPVMKYTLARLGLFVACAVVVFLAVPGSVNPLLKLLIALVLSAAGSYFLLRRWRDEVAEQLAAGSARRKGEKERLRAALAGEDEKAQ
jgi:hypothetical protein